MMMFENYRRRDDGFAMLLVLIVVAALSLLGIVGSRSAQTELRIAEKDLQGKQALSVAEAGINHAYVLLKSSTGLSNELSSSGTGGTLANLGTLASLGGVSYRFKQLGTGANDGYYVKAVDNWDEQTGTNNPSTDSDNKVWIMSVGTAGSAQRSIFALMSIKPGSGPGFFGQQYVTISASSIDSFDSSIGPYSSSKGSSADLKSNGKVTLSGSYKVKGNITTAGTVSGYDPTKVTGTLTQGATPLSFPPVPACGPPYGNMGAGGSSGISGGKFDPVKGTWTVSGGSTVATLAAGNYCFSAVTLSGGCTLDIGGAVQMYATGQVNFSGGTLGNTSQLATNFQLYSSYNAPKNQNGVVISSGGANTFMKIYAPNTGTTFSGGGNFYGQVIASSITDTGGTALHYDLALGGSGGANPKLLSWHEVRN